MGGVELLAAARALGLEVTEQQGRLKVRGQVEHEGLVRQLAIARAEVLAALRAEAVQIAFQRPTTRCRCCGGRVYWQRKNGHWLCTTCHPEPCQDVVEGYATAVVERTAWPLGSSVMALLHRHEWEFVADGVADPGFDESSVSDGQEGGGDGD